MSRSGRRVRFPAGEALPAAPQPVPVLGPVAFSLHFSGVEQHYDLSDLPCPRLVRAMAQALTEIGGDNGSQRTRQGFAQFLRAMRMFVGFVAKSAPSQTERFNLADLSPQLIDAFERKLLADHPPTSGQPWAVMAAVVRLLRLVHQAHPGVFSVEFVGRIGYALAASTQYVKTPVDAYPPAVFAAIEQAALSSVRGIRDRILRGEQLAAAGEDPVVAGWGKPENVLWHVANRGPLLHQHSRPAGLPRYGLRDLNAQLFVTRDDLLPFLVLLICQTGMEPECVKGLRANCLVNPARGFVSIAYVKHRAPGNSHKTLRVADGGALHYPGGVARLAQRLTQLGRDLLKSDALWVDIWDDGLHESFADRRKLDLVVARWMRQHGLDSLRDRDGSGIRLDLRRLRKSFKSERYLRAAGMLPDFAVGHSIDTAAEHYADIGAHQQLHETAVEYGLREALDAALTAPVVLDDTGRRLDNATTPLPDAEVRAALTTDHDVWLASCRSFYDSPFARKKGSACPAAAWGCLECPNAVFTTRHLPSVLSFLTFVDIQREALSTDEWQARYSLARQRITTGILPRFTEEQLRTARAIAESSGIRASVPATLLQALT